MNQVEMEIQPFTWLFLRHSPLNYPPCHSQLPLYCSFFFFFFSLNITRLPLLFSCNFTVICNSINTLPTQTEFSGAPENLVNKLYPQYKPLGIQRTWPERSRLWLGSLDIQRSWSESQTLRLSSLNLQRTWSEGLVREIYNQTNFQCWGVSQGAVLCIIGGLSLDRKHH